jgi:hypothetical protein
LKNFGDAGLKIHIRDPVFSGSWVQIPPPALYNKSVYLNLLIYFIFGFGLY